MKEILNRLVDFEIRRRELVQATRGLYLPEGQAKLIWQGRKSLVLLNKPFDIAHEKLLIFGIHYAYGYVWLDKPFKIRSRKEFVNLMSQHQISTDQLRRWDWQLPLYAYKVKKKELFKTPRPIKFQHTSSRIVINPERFLIHEKSSDRELTKKDYKALLKSDNYANRPLPSKYYKQYREGEFWAQMHVRGIEPEDYDRFQKHEIEMWELFTGHSLHVDWRAKFQGRKELMQFVLLEDSIESYIRVLSGKTDPRTKNVAKGLVVIKPSAEPASERGKEKKEMLLSDKDAKLVASLMLRDKSFFIAPGDVGATPYAYAYLGAIVLGTIKSGVMRPDFKEVFTQPFQTLPPINRALFVGRWIWKAFNKPRKLWWAWQAIRNPFPANPWCECDQGNYDLLPAEKLKYFAKEDYPEWKKRKADCL